VMKTGGCGGGRAELWDRRFRLSTHIRTQEWVAWLSAGLTGESACPTLNAAASNRVFEGACATLSHPNICEKCGPNEQPSARYLASARLRLAPAPFPCTRGHSRPDSSSQTRRREQVRQPPGLVAAPGGSRTALAWFKRVSHRNAPRCSRRQTATARRAFRVLAASLPGVSSWCDPGAENP
jgi:hypothetical protein